MKSMKSKKAFAAKAQAKAKAVAAKAKPKAKAHAVAAKAKAKPKAVAKPKAKAKGWAVAAEAHFVERNAMKVTVGELMRELGSFRCGEPECCCASDRYYSSPEAAQNRTNFCALSLAELVTTVVTGATMQIGPVRQPPYETATQPFSAELRAR